MKQSWFNLTVYLLEKREETNKLFIGVKKVKPMIKGFFIVCLILILSMALTACKNDEETTAPEDIGEKQTTNEAGEDSEEEGTPEPQPGGDLIIGSSGNPTTFNPIYWSDVSPSGTISGLIFNGLISVDPNLSPEPDLAKKWDISDDGLTWTFYLRDDVTFSDGQPFTAEDVKFTYSIPLDPNYTGPRGSEFQAIESIEVVDEYTVKFTLKEPKVGFIWTANYGILPKHILKDVAIGELGEHEFGTQSPIGTGPFKFVEWKDGEYVKLERNEKYFDGSPYLDSMTFKFVQDPNALVAQLIAGEVDVNGVQPADYETIKGLEDEGKVKLTSYPSFSYSFIGYDLKNPLFEDKEVRQALSMAIDRQSIVDVVLNSRGEIANASLPPASWAYDDSNIPVFNYDPAKAKETFAAAGWKDTDGDGVLDKDGKKFEFELLTGTGNKAWEEILLIVQQQWKEVGIDVKITVLEWSAFVNNNLLAKNFEAVLSGWSVGLDPDQSWLFHTDAMENGYNLVSYSNSEVDKLLDEQLTVFDQDERKRIISDINAKIAEDQPFTFLYYNTTDVAVPANLEGLVDNAPSLYYHPEKWYFTNN
jgi:peptide/nickel transport system substrate-binding protein